MLQEVKRRFTLWLPWVRDATKADVELTPLGGGAFAVVAKWAGGEHRKIFDAAEVLRQGRVRCAKDYARSFVKEVLGKRGVL